MNDVRKELPTGECNFRSNDLRFRTIELDKRPSSGLLGALGSDSCRVRRAMYRAQKCAMCQEPRDFLMIAGELLHKSCCWVARKGEVRGVTNAAAVMARREKEPARSLDLAQSPP